MFIGEVFRDFVVLETIGTDLQDGNEKPNSKGFAFRSSRYSCEYVGILSMFHILTTSSQLTPSIHVTDRIISEWAEPLDLGKHPFCSADPAPRMKPP